MAIEHQYMLVWVQAYCKLAFALLWGPRKLYIFRLIVTLHIPPFNMMDHSLARIQDHFGELAWLLFCLSQLKLWAPSNLKPKPRKQYGFIVPLPYIFPHMRFSFFVVSVTGIYTGYCSAVISWFCTRNTYSPTRQTTTCTIGTLHCDYGGMNYIQLQGMLGSRWTHHFFLHSIGIAWQLWLQSPLRVHTIM